MRKLTVLVVFCMFISVVSGQKNLYVFRNNPTINTISIQLIDSMKIDKEVANTTLQALKAAGVSF